MELNTKNICIVGIFVSIILFILMLVYVGILLLMMLLYPLDIVSIWLMDLDWYGILVNHLLKVILIFYGF